MTYHRTPYAEQLFNASQSILFGRILLFSTSNVGKSSLVCTLTSAVLGERDQTTEVRTVGGDHTTVVLSDFPLVPKVSVVDPWGWDFLRLRLDLFEGILNGRVKFGEHKDNVKVGEQDPNRICNSVLFILSPEEIFTPSYLEHFKTFYQSAKQMGRTALFAISKLDLHVEEFNDIASPEKAKIKLLNSDAYKNCVFQIQKIIDKNAVCFPLVSYQPHINQQDTRFETMATDIILHAISQIKKATQLVSPQSEIFNPFKNEKAVVLR